MDVEAIRRFTILASAVDHSWRAMEKSLESKWVLPALTLTYCFIDNMAYLAADETEIRVRPRFERWVAEWMLSRGRLSCEASDLYGARCAVVHTWSAESSVSEKGEAKHILYYYGNADSAPLHDRASRHPGQYVVVHLDTLIAETKEAGALAARKDDAPAAHHADLTKIAGWGSCSEGGGLIHTTSG
jgi:hypothetical protein